MLSRLICLRGEFCARKSVLSTRGAPYVTLSPFACHHIIRGKEKGEEIKYYFFLFLTLSENERI